MTLPLMAKGAREAANIFGFREWAVREAIKANSRRNYVDQLRALFDAIVRRWRYVQEPGEWVHATGVSLIRHVLGTKYNGDPDLEKTSLEFVPDKHKGWGDCDDIAQVIAAGAMAIGMKPYFRVVQTGKGGHVSVVVQPPKGDPVSLDPVGLPEHPFGWMMPARPDQVTYYDMQASQAPSLGACDCSVNKTALLRAERTFKPIAPTNTHYVRSWPGMMPPNVLAVRRGGYLSATECRDALEGTDDHGQDWLYSAAIDLWEPVRDAWGNPVGPAQLDGFLDDAKRRWQKRIKAVRGVVKKVREIHNKVVAKILSNKVGQRLVGTALMAVGVPPTVAPAVMTAASEIIKKGGLIGLLKLLKGKNGGKAALRLVAAAAKKGILATGLVPPAAQKYLQGLELKDGTSLATDIRGEVVPVWPVSAIIEVPLGAASDWTVAKKVPDTAAESANVKIAVADRPTSSRGQTRKPGQSEADWLSNVVLWETYPNSPDVLDTKIKSHKPYVTAWIRINKNVSNGLKVKNVSPAAFAVNTSEGAIVQEVMAERPLSQTHKGKVQKRPGGKSDQDWYTNVAYWRAYPEGPTTIGSDKNHGNAWRRMNTMVVDSLKSSTKTTTPKTTTPKTTTPKTTTPKTTTPKTTTPKTTTPKTTTPSTTTPQQKMSSNCWEDVIRQMSVCQDVIVNPEERAIAMAVAQERPKSELVQGATIHQGTKDDVNWLTNVAYWRAYPEGPADIPASAGQYASAWTRLKPVIVANLKTPKTKTPKTKTPKTELPDLDPQEMACLRSGGQWDATARMCRTRPETIEPKREMNWLPIVAGAAALLLAVKGG